jgi:hypothetical protein
MRFLVYTTLAYGAQGISYYVYCFPDHIGSIAKPDGSPTPLYDALRSLNREFVAIAKELQPLKSMDVFHTGMQPPGVKPLPEKSSFRFDPPVPAMDYQTGHRVQGVLLSCFGSPRNANPTHVLVVNLDYKTGTTVNLIGPAPLEIFDASTGKWAPSGGSTAKLLLAAGGGKLVRVVSN